MTPQDTADAPGRLARALAAVVAGVVRVPALVVAVGLVLVALAGWLAAERLQYRTQRNDLISAEKECQKRWQRYLDEFGDDDDLIVVVRGGDRERMSAATETIARRLQERPELFDRVFHKVDLRNLYSRSLFYLSHDELKTVEQRLDGMDPLLGRFGAIGWQTLSLQALLVQASFAQQSSHPSTADRDLLATLPKLLDSANRTLENPSAYVNPWQVADQQDRANELRVPQQFFTPDGKLALVLARPVKESQSFTPVRTACVAARAILDEARGEFPDLDFGLTGLPVLETDEMAASQDDSQFASALAIVGVGLLYLLVYRGLRYPLLTVSTLLVGSVWALGWATLTVGHLNILSTTFAVMLIGLGDYGVLWVSRYDEERRLGSDPLTALMATAIHAGPGIATASLTTSLAFFATMLADFQAVAELGWIAGCGVLFCAVACFTFLPALMILVERRRSTETDRMPIPIAGARPFLPIISTRPKLILLLSLFAVCAAVWSSGRVRYDANLLNMQADGLDSVAWEHELIEHAAGATWDAISLAESRTEALRLKAIYEQSPHVGRVVEAASLIPEDGEGKRASVTRIHEKLNGLPSRIPEPLASDVSTVRNLLAGLKSIDTTELRSRLQQPGAAERLREFDRRMRRDLLTDLQELRAVSHPQPIQLSDLPLSFRQRYIGAHGDYLVRAFAMQSLWEFDQLETFTRATEQVDPNATGKSFRTLEGLRQMKSGFEQAALLALGVIVIVLWLDLRRGSRVLLGLFPLAAGIVTTLGVMGLVGIPLNPANLISLPLIVGVGVDHGVHILHDYSEKEAGKLYRLSAATGRGIAVAALTTILGFGTLTLARHRGMAGMGLTLALGVTCCMVAALVVLPALLRWLDQRALHRANPIPKSFHPSVRKAA